MNLDIFYKHLYVKIYYCDQYKHIYIIIYIYIYIGKSCPSLSVDGFRKGLPITNNSNNSKTSSLPINEEGYDQLR